jgi:hypothetical protein
MGDTKPGQSRTRLAELAGDIRSWDADRQRLSHKENHEGGAFDQWHDSDDWAVTLVRTMQDILGDATKATPVKFCPPGGECENCAAIDN